MRKGFASFWWLSVVSAVLILALYVSYYFFIPWFVHGGGVARSVENPTLAPWDKCGVFGDTYGALTCLFTAFAFWGALITLWIQYVQAKDGMRQVALEHLPVVVKTPKSGHMTAGITASGDPVLIFLFSIEESNASNDAALNLAHRASLTLTNPKCMSWVRRINYANNLQHGRPSVRNESFAIFGRDGVDAVLKSLVTNNVTNRLVLKTEVAYRNFFNSYAKGAESYRVKLKDRSSCGANIHRILDSIAAGNSLTQSDMVMIKNIEIVIANIAEDSFLGPVSRSDYCEFCGKDVLKSKIGA